MRSSSTVDLRFQSQLGKCLRNYFDETEESKVYSIIRQSNKQLCPVPSKSTITAASSSLFHLHLAEIIPFKIKLVHASIHFSSNQN